MAKSELVKTKKKKAVNAFSQYLTPEEANSIIESCVGKHADRDKLILRTMWETGGRVSEVLRLVPECIEKSKNKISLPNFKQGYALDKAPLKEIFLFKESTLCQDLLNYCEKNNISLGDWVFKGNSSTGQVSSTYIWYLLSYVPHKTDIYKRKAGLATIQEVRKNKGGKKKSAWPHLFRHGAAMEILRRTENLEIVAGQLGHSDIKTTQIYARFTAEKRKDIIDHAKE